MDNPTLVTRLMADLKANPAKVAVLGLLLAVAVYFWVPLVGQLFAPSRTASIEPQTLNIAAAIPVEEAKKNRTWREITDDIAEDPNTKPSPKIEWERNPFEMVIEPVEPEPEISEIETVDDFSDVQIQMLLKGTLVSANKKTALINDDSYQQGETIELASGFALQISEVSTRYVVLEANGTRIQLELNTPTTISASQFRKSD